MTFRTARLGEVCDINPKMSKSLDDGALASFLPMAAVSEEGRIAFEEERTVAQVKKGYTYFERGDVLVAKITPCFENGKATRTVSLSKPFGFGSTEFHVLRAANDVAPDYLFYKIWNSSFRELGAKNMTGSAGQKRVPVDFLKRLEIRLPPLDEQRRIAAILDKADALRRRRKRALDLLDSLTRSIFLEMFGNSEHGKKARSEPIGSVCDVGSGSTPRREEATNFGGNIRWVKTTEVKGNVINETEEKVTEKGAKSARLRLYPSGTVLIAMYGQGSTRGKVGILGVDATTNQACAALVPGPKLNPVFLFHQLRQSYESLRDLGRGGNQPNLNGELVKKFEVLVPPLNEQNQFVEIMHKASKQDDLSRVSLLNLDAIFSALQSRAFSGQL